MYDLSTHNKVFEFECLMIYDPMFYFPLLSFRAHAAIVDADNGEY